MNLDPVSETISEERKSEQINVASKANPTPSEKQNKNSDRTHPEMLENDVSEEFCTCQKVMKTVKYQSSFTFIKFIR